VIVDNSFIARLSEELTEIVRLKQLNEELLDNLQLTILWFIDYHRKTHAPIPNIDVLSSLIRKTDFVLKEIGSSGYAGEPFKSRKLPFRKDDDRNPKELPECSSQIDISIR